MDGSICEWGQCQLWGPSSPALSGAWAAPAGPGCSPGPSRAGEVASTPVGQQWGCTHEETMRESVS